MHRELSKVAAAGTKTKAINTKRHSSLCDNESASWMMAETRELHPGREMRPNLMDLDC